MKDILLDIKDLDATYDTEDGIVRAVNNVSIEVVRGKTLGLLGETGAGKTTMAKCVLRILPERVGNIRKGSIVYDGVDLLKLNIGQMRAIRGKKISMIFQDPMSSLNPVLRVGEQIAEVLELHSGKSLADRNNIAIQKRVDEILEMVGIPADRGREYPHQFSGGMKQRVVIAMALVCEPELVIADEPTTALDVTIQAQVLDMMEKLKREFNTSMLLITHDLGVVAETCDDAAVMYAGEIIEYGSVEDIFDPCAPHHPYTSGLFGSIPRLDDELPRLSPIGGLIPDPTNLPVGCKFGPRCSYRTEHCDVPPPNVAFDGSHTVRCLICLKEGV
jgi:peptide/nickel transport system ATP-binding protein